MFEKGEYKLLRETLVGIYGFTFLRKNRKGSFNVIGLSWESYIYIPKMPLTELEKTDYALRKLAYSNI